MVKTFFFYGCALVIAMYLAGSSVIFPWSAFLDDDYGGGGGYYRGTGGYHK
jgi:hypothetical protein